MSEFVERRPNLFIALLAGYFLLCIGLRLAVSNSLEIDEAEQAFVSQFLRLGYGAQPPLYNWLQYGLGSVFGPSLATMTVLKNLLLFLCCLFYGLAAREVLAEKRLALIAMLGVLTLPPIFLLAQRDLSHTVAALFAVSLFLYGFLRTLARPSLAAYVLTGLAVGIGLIAKYNFALVPAAAVLAILPEHKLRERLFDWRVLVSLVVAALIALPHGWWVLENLGSASNNTFLEMREAHFEGRLAQAFHGVVSLIAATIRGSVVPLVVFGLIFRKSIPAIWSAQSQWTRVVGRMLAICLVAVLLIVLGVGATHIREKWLVLFLILLPLYLCLKVEAAGVDVTFKLRPFLWLVAFIVLTTLVVVSTRAIVRPLFGKYSRLSIPYATLAETVVKLEGREPALILATDKLIAGNLRTHLQNTPVLTASYFGAATANASMPLLVVWSDDGKAEPILPETLADAMKMRGFSTTTATPQVLSLPYLHGKTEDRYTFGYLWVTN
ncbi:ArnT family glycosyltransferase [Ensifer sp. 4252]|uniref:ArnT family glycosyltransferase n=1 Tax=Ensifer sp. 4252 TaxID=3373915 RepID=UPI003D1CE786